MNDKPQNVRSDSHDSETVQLLKRIEAKLDSINQRESSGSNRGYFSIKNAAIYCDLSQKTLRRFIEGGKLTAYRPAKGKILLKRKELEAFIGQCTKRVRIGRGIRR